MILSIPCDLKFYNTEKRKFSFFEKFLQLRLCTRDPCRTIWIIFLFHKDPNVSLTHSLSHSLSHSVTHSVTQQKVSSNSTKIFLWVKLIDLITLLMFPTWNLTLGSEFLDFWWKILLTESCQEALLSTNPVCEVDYWVQNVKNVKN